MGKIRFCPSGAGFTGCGKTQSLSFRGAFLAEESLCFLDLRRREIPRFARNDDFWDFFSSHFSLWVFVALRLLRLPPNPRGLKPEPLPFSQRCSPYSTLVPTMVLCRIMNRARKITVEVPEKLLEKAQRASGTGVTQTVRAGLQLVAASLTYARLRRFRGKVRFSRTLAELKADR